jgi:hypothetical protein
VKSFSVNQQILNAHALTVQALCQNDVLGNQQVHSNRTSEEIMGLGVEDSLKSKKKIHILPPPINVKSRGLGFKEHIPTPHPITIRKSYAHQSQANKHSVQNESFLALGLRWHTDRNPRRMMKLAIPADLDIASTRKVSSPRAKQHQTEMHFETLEFDDAHFFRELRKAYACLAGPFRFFSPRSLHKIEISHSGSCTNCRSSGSANPFLSPSLTCGIPSPRSPRFLISQGLTDSFSEANLLEQYHKPKIGKAQYIWVHWAHRISTTSLHLRSPVPMPPAGSPAERAATTGTHMGLSHNVIDDEASEADCVAGLDFVEKWAPWRILSAITLTVLLAIAAALIWIFLGMSSEALHTSFRGAGERVASGCLVGMFALLIGFAVVASWVSVSWLVN